MIVPALCKIHNIPYLGSDAYTVTLARNKFHTAAIVNSLGIKIPKTIIVNSINFFNLKKWKIFPAIVKPNYESSSIGLDENSIVINHKSLFKQVEKVINKYKQSVVVQQFIIGKEVQVSIIGNSTLKIIGLVELYLINKSGGYEFIKYSDWKDDNVNLIEYNGVKKTIELLWQN